VGLDVVKTKIESLGGSVQLESSIGSGTKITLKLPFTLAIIQALLVKISNQTYAIPTSSIVETFSIKREDVRTIGNQIKAVKVCGNILPLVELNKLLNIHGNSEENKDLTVVAVSRSAKACGLIVDSIVGEQEIVIKSLDPSLKKIKGLSGVTILGDGQIVLVLDAHSLLTPTSSD